jgi:hypothetical protein
MQPRKFVLCACLLVLLIVLGLRLRQEMRIDSCLDSGGRWNETQRVCEGVKGK